MTTDTASARLDDVIRSLMGGEHLPECRDTRRGDADTCDWCRWAIVTPDMTTLFDVAEDAERLRRADVIDTVPGVVAAGRLFELFDEIDPDRGDVASVRGFLSRIREETSRPLDEVARCVSRATRSDGPIDRRCRRTAGALAAAAMQAGVDAEVVGTLPPIVRAGLDELAATVSGGVQLATFLPVVEQLHWRGMPELITQPEWTRRTAPGNATAIRQRQLAVSGAAPGSLEALVLESVIDRCTEMLLDVGGRLAGAVPPVGYRRAIGERPFDAGLRATLWRILAVDWHLTFVDTGLATCWETHVIDGVRCTSVPWEVDLAARALRSRGYGSALFHHG